LNRRSACRPGASACLSRRTSLEVIRDAKVEPSLADAPAGARYQFERLGYFCVDQDSRPGALVFNRTVTLRDTWAKIQAGPGR